MKSVRKNDFYEVRLMGPFGSAQLSSLTDLYLPILGSNGFSAYLGLRSDESVNAHALLASHESLFARLSLTSGEFFDAMEKLEALALVSTFHKEEKDQALFVYCLHSPKLPGAFFDDVLLMGTLRSKLGEKAVAALEKKYAAVVEPEGFANVSAAFPSVYHPNYDDPSFHLDSKPGMNDGEGKIKTDFDLAQFISIVQKNGIAEETIAENEKKAIAQYGTLYGLDPESMFEIFLRCFQAKLPFGKRLDREKLGKEAMELLKFPYLKKQKKELSPNSGTNILAQKIRLMDSVSPSQYLYYLQGGSAPAS
ncbi:MAG: hypothetical protein J6038_05715, partial [Bacilli bacterium]|nr:hypothetical protein [Bacilli bacterium]